MTTLREMLVKIYQPRRGIIEFGPGQSTQDGNNTMAVLGGQPGAGGDDGGGMGGVDFPAFSGGRTAGLEGGTGGGGGLSPEGFDWSQFDPNDPQQFEMAKAMYERTEGGQAGEPGGAGAGSVEYGQYDTYVDPTLPELVGYFGPGPIGLVGSLGALGMRAHNAALLDETLEGYGLEGLGFGQQLGAALGFNDYGAGDLRGNLGVLGGQLRDARATGADLSAFDDFNASMPGALSPEHIAARSQQRVGALDFSGSSSYGGGAGERSRSSYRDTSPGRRGARESTRTQSQVGLDAARARRANREGHYAGGGSSGGGGGIAGANRDEAMGRGTGPGGFGAGHAGPGGGVVLHEGGYLHEDMVPGQNGADVPATLQEGEYVMSPEAVEAFGPQTFERMNNLAKMMRRQHYPARETPRAPMQKTGMAAPAAPRRPKNQIAALAERYNPGEPGRGGWGPSA